MRLITFLLIVTSLSVIWGRVNRFGYSKAITSMVRFIMRYSRVRAELLQSYLVWAIYLAFGLGAASALLIAYQVNLLSFLPLAPRYFAVVPLTFIAQTSLTGLWMQLLLVARPSLDVFAELTSVPWIRYTLMLPAGMRVVSPLGAAVVEEVFFRGTVFLILIEKFPQAGDYLAIGICTALFVTQQVLQTNTLGQALILTTGSISISVVGCLATLYTRSFLPTLLCHAAYAFVYLRLGTSMPKTGRKRKGKPNPRSVYPSF